MQVVSATMAYLVALAEVAAVQTSVLHTMVAQGHLAKVSQAVDLGVHLRHLRVAVDTLSSHLTRAVQAPQAELVSTCQRGLPQRHLVMAVTMRVVVAQAAQAAALAAAQVVVATAQAATHVLVFNLVMQIPAVAVAAQVVVLAAAGARRMAAPALSS